MGEAIRVVPYPKNQVWEYRTVNLNTSALNNAGAEGWEAVGLSGHDVLLKRLKMTPLGIRLPSAI